jgi:hypothetical protein
VATTVTEAQPVTGWQVLSRFRRGLRRGGLAGPGPSPHPSRSAPRAIRGADRLLSPRNARTLAYAASGRKPPLKPTHRPH